MLDFRELNRAAAPRHASYNLAICVVHNCRSLLYVPLHTLFLQGPAGQTCPLPSCIATKDNASRHRHYLPRCVCVCRARVRAHTRQNKTKNPKGQTNQQTTKQTLAPAQNSSAVQRPKAFCDYSLSPPGKANVYLLQL